MLQNNKLYSHQGFLFKNAILESINNPAFNQLSDKDKNKLIFLKDKLTFYTQQNKYQNGRVEERTRLHYHYEEILVLSLDECWDKCLQDNKCRSICFQEKPHEIFKQVLYVCFLYSSSSPTRSQEHKEYFTSIFRNSFSTKCNCNCLVIT